MMKEIGCIITFHLIGFEDRDNNPNFQTKWEYKISVLSTMTIQNYMECRKITKWILLYSHESRKIECEEKIFTK